MKQNNMQIPEGYKNSSLGIIPNDWEVKEFGLFSKLNKSKYLPKINEHHRCLELEHISQIDGTLLGWVDSANQKSSKNVFLKGQVLFGKLRPYLRKYWFAQFDGVCSSEIWVLNSIKAFCIDEYLYRIIQSNKFIQVSNVSSGSKMPRADWDYVYSFPFSLPPLPQQQKIAEILGTWDEAIEKQSKLIDKLTDRKRGLMQQLLTGKKRLAGFSEEWKEVRLGEICDKISNGITYNTDLAEGYPVTRIETISKGVIDYAKIGFAQEVNNMESYKLQKGDILFSHINSLAHIGKVAIYKGENPLYHGMNLLLLRTSIKANDYYLFYFLCSSAARNKIQSLAKQAVNQASVNIEELKKWFILLPSLPEQIAIANILTAADKEIQLAKSKLELLRSQKSGLMQELLTGKTRVKI